MAVNDRWNSPSGTYTLGEHSGMTRRSRSYGRFPENVKCLCSYNMPQHATTCQQRVVSIWFWHVTAYRQGLRNKGEIQVILDTGCLTATDAHCRSGKWQKVYKLPFQTNFLEQNVLYFDSNFNEYGCEGLNWQWCSLCSGNGLAPTRRQTVNWTEIDSYLYVMIASVLVLHEDGIQLPLSCQCGGKIYIVSTF